MVKSHNNKIGIYVQQQMYKAYQ